MVQIDGEIHLANDAAGNANIASHEMKNHFALTTHFKADKNMKSHFLVKRDAEER